MILGINWPLISVPLRLLLFTTRSAAGSPQSSRTLSITMSAPIFLRISMIPVRVGLIPTPLILICEFCKTRQAMIKKAAEEISPGTVICLAFNSEIPSIKTVLPLTSTGAPRYFNIRSVWSLDGESSVRLVLPAAYSPARRTQDFTWALATGEW